MRSRIYFIAIAFFTVAAIGQLNIGNPFFVGGVLKRASAGGPADPTILWWKLNDGSGTAINSDAGPDGTTDGTWGSGYLTVNGTSQEAFSDTAIATGVQVVTVSIWVNASTWNAGGSFRLLFETGTGAGGNGQINCYEQFGEVHFGVRQSGGVRDEYITSGLSTGSFQHIVAVFDNSTASGEIKVYINGSGPVSTTLSDAKADTGNIMADTFNLCSRNSGASGWFGCDVDDVRIYSGELSSGDISTIYAAGRQ